MSANVIEKQDAAASAAYDQDFYKWTEDMAQRLRARDVSALDWDNIAEEIESVGKRDYRSLRSRMGVLLVHLLKWRYQPEKRSRSWLVTIHTQREQIEGIVADSPSLRDRIAADMQGAYRAARRKAALETTIYLKNFPAECPWTFESALAEELGI